MKRVVLRVPTLLPPFGEPARDLRIMNKPLWLLQRDLLARHCRGTLEVDSLADVPASHEELLVHKDNLYFNEQLVDAFVAAARARNRPCQLAFAHDDKAITAHALKLQEGIRFDALHGVYRADMYFFPHGLEPDPEPLVIDSDPQEMGYYHIPSYMARNHGDLVFQIPLRAFLSIENWVHIFLANSPFGVFAWARAMEKRVRGRALQNWLAKFEVVTSALREKLNPFGDAWRSHWLSCPALVKVGRNCSIDPTAVIHGPAVIGDNVTIGAGSVIVSSLIGNNVNIMQGCQVMLSVVSDRCYLPFNAGLFMTTLMENSMVAQNSTLQLCVVGRNTFIGANTVFTDFNLMDEPIRTAHRWSTASEPTLEDVGLPVLGSAVGHNVKIGSGFAIYPARLIDSFTTLIYAQPETVINRNVVNPRLSQPDPMDGSEPRTVYKWPHPLEGPVPEQPGPPSNLSVIQIEPRPQHARLTR